MRPAIEKAALSFLSQRKFSLDVGAGQSAAGWIYLSKTEQLVRSDYPYYVEEWDDHNTRIPGDKEENAMWSHYYNWRMTTIFQILLASFGDLDSSVFDTHDFLNMTSD